MSLLSITIPSGSMLIPSLERYYHYIIIKLRYHGFYFIVVCILSFLITITTADTIKLIVMFLSQNTRDVSINNHKRIRAVKYSCLRLDKSTFIKCFSRFLSNHIVEAVPIVHE